jgi:hypothetical protein
MILAERDPQRDYFSLVAFAAFFEVPRKNGLRLTLRRK